MQARFPLGSNCAQSYELTSAASDVSTPPASQVRFAGGPVYHLTAANSHCIQALMPDELVGFYARQTHRPFMTIHHI